MPDTQRPSLPLVLALAAVAGLAVLACRVDARAAQPDPAPAARLAPAPAAQADGPVVVELFTSQGCSSCPPADRLLTRLGKDPKLATRVFPLAFHVDYWNYIGWTDPFSSARWSDRQRSYARAFGSNRVYTPQLVVDGTTDCVGSQEDLVYRKIHQALARPVAGRVELRLAPGSGPNELQAVADASVAREISGRLELWVALYQKNLTTAVARGENADRTLRNDYVVRRLTKAFTLSGGPGAHGSGTVSLALDPSWRRSDLGVVAFLQDPASRAIEGAARATLEIME